MLTKRELFYRLLCLSQSMRNGARFPGRGINMSQVGSLLINTSAPCAGIGDILFCFPFIQTMRNYFPHIKIGVMVSQDYAREVLELLRYPVYVHQVPVEVRTNPRRFFNYVRQKMKPSRYDIIVNGWLEDSFSVALVSSFLKSKYTIAYNPFPDLRRNYVTNFKLDYDVRRFLISYDDSLKTIFQITSWESYAELLVEKRDDLKKEYRLDDKRITLGVHIGEKKENKKNWSPDSFGDVILYFIRRYSGKVMIFLGPREELDTNLARKIDGAGEVRIVKGETIKECAYLVNRCSLFLSNDTGIMNLALALRKQVVGIFGPTHSSEFVNFFKNIAVVRSGRSCSPCRFYSHYLSCQETYPPCLEDVDSGRVMSEIDLLLTNFSHVENRDVRHLRHFI